jgi:hypothetical protein|tara:strand:+ start:571 stop:741 length:171 start_codon:yes stop_codon:yes gene_type:complete
MTEFAYTTDAWGRRYHVSQYKLEEHKYRGWFWEHETKMFWRWNDMIDYYRREKKND